MMIKWKGILIIMIKVKWLVGFSTLRFPIEYVKTFHLNRQLRSCISLGDLQRFVSANDEAIRQHGKTIVLEYFNQFPLGYSYRTLRSPLMVYKYVFSLEGLTLYEEQLKFANICKILEYAPLSSKELVPLAHQQERRIIECTKRQAFDLVDALNWILFQRVHLSTELSEYSLEIICAAPIEASESMMAKLLNSFLKKIQDLQWHSLRKYRPLFEFICYKYELSIESPKLMVSNFEKLVELKLHLVGYDRIPRAIDQIALRLEGELKNLEMHHLQTVFKCFDDLPTSYNPRLFDLLYREILSRLKREIFHLNCLPVNRLTREQLETFMTAFVQSNLLSVRSCIYFINCEESQQLFRSEVFLKALTSEFLRPLSTQFNMTVDYVAYMSVAHILLSFNTTVHATRTAIIQQLKEIQKAVLSSLPNPASLLNFNCSLCSRFSIFALDLEFHLFEDRKGLGRAMEEEVLRFKLRKTNSNWKSRKHHQQLRETIRRHADSPLPEVRSLLITLLTNELATAPYFDSNYFPSYIYMLEDCAQAEAYQVVLSPLYNFLRGDNALAFIEAYIRNTKKSAKMTLAIMKKLWNINHSPIIMLKLAAGVPIVYFENGVGGLLADAASLFEDVAIFIKGGDLEHFSVGELSSLVKFCRQFVKSTRLLSHKLLILTLSKLSSNFEEKAAKLRDPAAHIELLIELLNLTLDLSYSDKQLCITRIGQLVVKFQESNFTAHPLMLLRLLEVKLLLKGSISINVSSVKQTLCALIQRVLTEKDLEDRAKIAIVLLKLYFLEEVELKPEVLRQFCQISKDSLKKQELFPNDIPLLLSAHFIQQSQIMNFAKIHEIKQIIQFSLKEIRVQEKPQHYIYILRLAHRVRAPEMIECCLDHLTLLPLEPPFIIALVNILKYYTGIYRSELIERILKDTAVHFNIFFHHHIDILYYINAVCYQIPPAHANTYALLLQQVEKDLTAATKTMLAERNPDPEQLFQLLVKTYKYYWVVIKNKQVSNTTFNIFKLNIRFIKNIFEILNFRSIDGISEELIYMTHLALFPKASLLEQQQNPRTSFFSGKSGSKAHGEYHEWMRKMEAMMKSQAVRSFNLQEQLRKQKIYYKKVKESSESYYTFRERKNGIQLHYCIHNAAKDHYIFFMIPKMRNSAGLYKGRVKFLQELYAIILQSEPIIFDEKEPISIYFD